MFIAVGFYIWLWEYRQTSPLFYRLYAAGEFSSVAIWRDLNEGSDRTQHNVTSLDNLYYLSQEVKPNYLSAFSLNA